MNEMPPTACRTNGCGGYAVAGGKCEACQPAAQPATGAKSLFTPYAIKSQELFFKEKHSKRWKDLRAMRLRGNPQCQLLLEDGTQCTAASVVGHHLKVSRELIFAPENIVMLCPLHHSHIPGEQEDAPRNFVDSVWTTFAGKQRFVHPKHNTDKRSAQGMALSCRLAGLPE